MDPWQNLPDVIDIADQDAAVGQLLNLGEIEFDDAVLAWLLGGRVGTEIMRDHDVVERTYDALCRLRDRLQVPELAEDLVDRFDLSPDMLEALTRAVPEERHVAKRVAHEARLAREADSSLTGRALNELKRRHESEFLQIKRELRRARGR